MPPIKIPVKPRPPVPPGSAVWPPKPQPPDPGPITPPPGGPRGDPPPKVDPPDGIAPGGQPPTPGPTPSGIAPDWSDANVLTQHRAGQYRVRAWVRDALVLDRTLPFTGMTQQTYINECVHAHLRFAPNTQTEPWPVRPGMAGNAKDMVGKEALMADKPTVEQEILAGLAELRHGLAVLGDQIAALTARLDGQPTQPPASAEDPDVEFWRMFFSTPLPDAETFTPEAFASYDRGRVLYQWLANRTPLGKRLYRDVEGEMFLLRAMYDDPEGQTAMMFRTAGVDWETAVYAILSGRMDVLFDPMAFATRRKEKALELAGKTAEALFQQDIAADGQGGTPGIGG